MIYENMREELDIYDDGEYKTQVAPHRRTNVLLVNKPLGKVIPTTRTLPGPGHTYGFIDAHDDEGAGDVVGSWQEHRRGASSVPGKDFVRSNKYAAMTGAVTAKNFATFRRCNDIRLAETSRATGPMPYYPTSDTVFGRPSPDSAPVSDLINNTYQRKYIAEQRMIRENRQRQRTHRARYTQSRHTKASLGHTKVAAPAPKPMFKLKQFQNVPSRISTMNAMTTGSIPKYGRRSTATLHAAPQPMMQNA